ncbi:MAG: AAA family ATPase [Candidatus Methylumidiphilus sp.]
MHIKLPELALVLLLGPSGAGKSTFARRHFLPTEVVSSDHCRALVCDDENDQSVTPAAFEILNLIVAKRLRAGRLTVVDATNVQPAARKPLIALARQHYCPTAAIVLDLPLWLCLERNAARLDRDLAGDIIRSQRGQLHAFLPGLEKEGIRHVHIIREPADLHRLEIIRQPAPCNEKIETGPFDLIGDVHGCFDELTALLLALGYRISPQGEGFEVYHPDGRKLVFLGDLVDRGPNTPAVLRLAMDAVRAGDAFCVAGNHDAKLVKALQGQKVTISHGLAESLQQLDGASAEFRAEVVDFLSHRPGHYVFDQGRLVAAHAGLKEEMHGRHSGKVLNFCLYGETTGATDEFGLPIRYPWAADYRGQAMVVYGHTPVQEAEWLNNTLCIDTGCVFGGKLTALRYPEKELVSVPALKQYFHRARPLAPPASAQAETQ